MTKDLPPLSALILLPTSDLARQRKADTTAAAAAAIVAAAKAARSTNGVRLCSDPVLLGKDLIHRVDHATIAAAVDKHVLEPMSTIADSPSTVYTSAEDDANGDDAYSLFEKNQESPESLFMPSVQHNYTDRHYSREEVNASAHISICKYTLTELHAMRRDAAVNELLATEESYCRDLHILVNHFFAGIIDANCISDDAKQQLVRNGFSIFKFQSMFSAALLKSSGGSHGVIMSNVAAYHPYRDDRVISIARCFCEWGDKFDVYIDYCINHDKAVNLYKELTETNQSFAAVMNKLHQVTRASAGGGNGRRMFDDYLIMPVQRLFKYKLILESILKTTQSDSPEYTSLSQALIIMHEVAVRLNTKKSHMEAERKTQLFMDRLVSDWANAASKRFYGLLGPCLLIGTLDVRAIHDNAKIKRLGCALFNSYMIMVKAKRDDKYVPRHWFPLRTFHLEDIQCTFVSSISI
ncbi:Dbl homology domain-containing protein [Dichotomocladium elegans]|nr:Dbl homology domain-containing protein [Dichotomocladium elegans]